MISTSFKSQSTILSNLLASFFLFFFSETELYGSEEVQVVYAQLYMQWIQKQTS